MASSSSSMKPSDEEELDKAELEKAVADLHELIAREPIPDEFKFLCPEEEEYIKKKERDKDKKNKKKKVYKLRQEDLQMLLDFKGDPLDEHTELAKLEEEDKEKYKDLRTLVTVTEVFVKHLDKSIHANQEKIRHELQTKGYVTYEVTDDEDEEEAAVPAAAPQAARGGGRRRHRPGVTKSAGGVVKKLN